MFLPYPFDLQKFVIYPAVWLLLFINIFGFLTSLNEKERPENYSLLFQTDSLRSLGNAFDQNILQADPSKQTHQLTQTQKIWLGIQSLRDKNFIESAPTLQFSADPILDTQVKDEMSAFESIQKDRKSYYLGLRANSHWMSYLTYQFTHANLLHLISNMVFLLGIGFYLESILGALGFVFLYLTCGVLGGLCFQYFQYSSFIPMVGASGAISGLLVFYALIEKRKNIRYLFFLTPFKGHYGFIYAPRLWIFPLFVVSDIAHFLSTPQSFTSGIAYAAHIGGAGAGVFLSLVWNRIATSRHPQLEQIHAAKYSPSPSQVP